MGTINADIRRKCRDFLHPRSEFFIANLQTFDSQQNYIYGMKIAFIRSRSFQKNTEGNMQFLKSRLVLLAAAASFHFTAQASPITTVHGFVQLSATTGLSINDFLSGTGGWNFAYHLASNQEIGLLLQIYGLSAHAESDDGVKESRFFREVGGKTPSGTDGTYFNDGAQGATGMSFNEFVSVGLTNGENQQPYPNCKAWTACSTVLINTGASQWNVRNNTVGLFLVQNAKVPEPNTVALFSLAGVLLLIGRRRSNRT